MKKILLISAIAAFLSGCVSQADQAKRQDEINKTIPVCTSDKQCEAAWSGARQWVTANCGMKIQTNSNEFIDTYNSVGSSTNTTCQVSKDILPSGEKAILIKVNCGNAFGCVPDSFSSVLKFNKDVGDYMSKFSPPKIGVGLAMAGKNGVIVQSAGESYGLLVGALVDGGSAKKSGMEKGDIITHIDGDRVNTSYDFGNKMSNHAIGDTVALTVIRSGNEIKLPVVI